MGITAGTGAGQINLSSSPPDGGAGEAFVVGLGTALTVTSGFTSIDGRTQSVNVPTVTNPANLSVGSDETTGPEVIVRNAGSFMTVRSSNTVLHSLGFADPTSAAAVGLVVSNDGATGVQSSPTTNVIVDTVKDAIDETPPELVADLMETGICLAGGGGLIRGLEDRIEDSVKIRVWVAEDPMTCVARGAGTVLEDFDYWSRVLATDDRSRRLK